MRLGARLKSARLIVKLVAYPENVGSIPTAATGGKDERVSL